MSIVGSGWRFLLCAVLVLLAAVSVAAAQGSGRNLADLTGDELDMIAPPDLSSPRATLQALRSNVQEARDAFVKGYDRYREEPGYFASPEVSAQVHLAKLLLRRAMATVDLSQVPLVSREETGTEAVLLIEEILQRLPAIDLETVPDVAEVAAEGLTAWTLPYTDIDIVRMAEGPKAGQFVFSAESIAVARDLYREIRFHGDRIPEGQDMYRFFTLTPGDLLPPKWYLLIEKAPHWVQTSFYLGHAIWQWAGIALTLIILFGAWWLIVRAITRRHEPGEGSPGFLRRIVPPVLLMGAAWLAKDIIVHEMSISGAVLIVASVILEGIVYLAAAWAAYLVCARLGERIAVSSGVGRTSIDASLIKVAARVAGIAAAITIIFVGATNIGLPVYGVIAGLGVGGLALGLAARPTLENLIGGFTLYADRPVRVGEVCKFGDEFGIVEEIGLRSTRLRAFDRTLITVPNADFSNMVLVNFTRRDRSLVNTTIGLRYGTTAAQLQTILDAIRAMLEADPKVDPEEIRVRFQAFGPFGLGIVVRAYIRTTHMSELLEVQEGILFAIMKIIGDAGAEIAVMPAVMPQGGPPPGAVTETAGE